MLQSSVMIRGLTLRSLPHFAHSRGDIRWPSLKIEEIEKGVRNKATPRREHISVAVLTLLAAEKPQRLNQVEMRFGACHGDDQYAAFFIDLLLASGRHV